MKRNVNRSGKNEIFLIAGSSLLIPVVLLSLWSVHLLKGTLQLQKHSLAVQSILDDIGERIKLIEIYRERESTPPLHNYSSEIDQSYARLATYFRTLEMLVADDQIQLESLLNLRESALELRHADMGSSLVRLGLIDDLISEMDLREKEKAAYQETELSRSIGQLDLFTIGMGIIAIVMVLFAGYSFRRELRIRKQMLSALTDSEQRAHSASMMKTRFLAAVSHEIRTPLNGIISLSDVLRTQKLSGENRKYVDIIFNSSKTLLRIINDLLDFSKIESGKLDFESQAFSPADVVIQTTSVLEQRARDKKITLMTEISPQLPRYVKGDFDRLAQVLYNLIGNSIKFTEAGQVIVRVAPITFEGDRRLQYSVQDTGVGITEKQRLKLFEPFQLNQPGTAGERGSGLGLSIAKQLVQLMGGELRFETNAGIGTKFWFDLPLVEPSTELTGETQIQAEAEKSPLPARYRDRQVLVVEDNPTNQTVAQSLLERLGLKVQLASNGEEALTLLSFSRFDLVFMDCQMPVMNGYEATKVIRSTGSLKNIPIVAMTANVTQGEREECLRIGMTDFISKPFLIEDLRKVTLACLSRDDQEPHLIEPSVIERLKNTVGAHTTSRVLHSFVGTLPEFRSRAEEYLRERDLERLSQLAHRFKSSSSAIGALDFAERCKALENMSKGNENFDEWERLISLSHSLEDEAKRYYHSTNSIPS